MKNTVRKVMMAATMFLSFATTMSAQVYQSLYAVRGSKALYDGKEIRQADVHTFQILGYGYAKDRYNVYLDGQVLRFVDPQTFRLHGNPNQPGGPAGGNQPLGEVQPGRGHDHETAGHGHGGSYYDNGYGYQPSYMVNRNDVYFNGKLIRDASGSSFKDLGDGYGKDAFRAYYYGERIPEASGSTFKVLTDGYSRDSFRAFYRGVVIEGANGGSFKVLADGYSRDAFNVYYLGQKVQGARASSFKVDGNGYAHDAFDYYYYGRKVNR